LKLSKDYISGEPSASAKIKAVMPVFKWQVELKRPSRQISQQSQNRPKAQ